MKTQQLFSIWQLFFFCLFCLRELDKKNGCSHIDDTKALEVFKRSNNRPDGTLRNKERAFTGGGFVSPAVQTFSGDSTAYARRVSHREHAFSSLPAWLPVVSKCCDHVKWARTVCARNPTQPRVLWGEPERSVCLYGRRNDEHRACRQTDTLWGLRTRPCSPEQGGWCAACPAHFSSFSLFCVRKENEAAKRW